MGAVYEARHARLAGRYAVKVLHPEIQQHPDVLRRFELEARVTSALRHPGIVQVIDFNITPDGAPYLVMEYLEGEDLGQLLAREGPLSLARTARICSQIAGALAAAHRRDVVHRDLKPQNIFLVPSDDEDEPERAKVLDFGISKIRSVSQKLTGAQVVMGTPQFMAPEQAEGNEDLDPAVDQFALGAIVYEMLTGRPAFFGDSLAAVIYQIVHKDPIPLRRFRPDLPASVEQILSVALAKDRRRRFLSVTDFARRLRAASGDPVAGAETGPVDVPAPERSGAAPAPPPAPAGPVDRRPLTTTLRRLTGNLVRWRTVVGTRAGKLAIGGAAVALVVALSLVFVTGRSNRAGVPQASPALAATHPATASASPGEAPARAVAGAPVVAPIAPVGASAESAVPPPLPASVPFELASEPSGIPVLIDGKPFPSPEQQASTWARGELPIGTHKIELIKPGYHPWRRTVEIKAGRPNRFLGRLQKEDPAEIFGQLKPVAAAPAAAAAPGPATGHLTTTSPDLGASGPPGGSSPCSMTVGSVPWTDLWVDGTNTHRHTPVASFLAPCGPHRVELRRGDLHIHLTTEVDLVPGRKAKLIYYFDSAGQVVPPPR